MTPVAEATVAAVPSRSILALGATLRSVAISISAIPVTTARRGRAGAPQNQQGPSDEEGAKQGRRQREHTQDLCIERTNLIPEKWPNYRNFRDWHTKFWHKPGRTDPAGHARRATPPTREPPTLASSYQSERRWGPAAVTRYAPEP
jgi:hypothetical protein